MIRTFIQLTRNIFSLFWIESKVEIIFGEHEIKAEFIFFLLINQVNADRDCSNNYKYIVPLRSDSVQGYIISTLSIRQNHFRVD